MMLANIKTAKKCAFCKYWYDPTNDAISPKSSKINLWNYDERCKNKCLRKNVLTQGIGFCPHYECKLEIM